MWGLFELLKLSFSSLIWGVLITILCLVLFFVLIKGWYRSATYTPLSYLIGAVLFLFLSFQCTMIVGGLKINSLSQEYYIQVWSTVLRCGRPDKYAGFYSTGGQTDPGKSYFAILYWRGRIFRIYSPAASPSCGQHPSNVYPLVYRAAFVVVPFLCRSGRICSHPVDGYGSSPSPFVCRSACSPSGSYTLFARHGSRPNRILD